MNRTKLQRILNKLDGKSEATAKAMNDFEQNVRVLQDKLQQAISISTLEEVNLKINQLRKSLSVDPVLAEVSQLKTSFSDNVLTILKDTEDKTAELRQLMVARNDAINSRIDPLITDIETINQTAEGLKNDLIASVNKADQALTEVKQNLTVVSGKLTSFAEKKVIDESLKEIKKDIDKGDEESKEYTDKAKRDLLSRLSNIGGGNMNRNIIVGGNPSTLGRYTDINIKAGSNMTITYANNATTKQTDITFASSGGGSSVAGTVRSINRISTSQTAGDTTGTDYVYIATAGINLTLPTAVSNTNLYTIKNISVSSVLVSTTGLETIDTDTNLILGTQFTAVDLVNDGNDNWSIT